MLLHNLQGMGLVLQKFHMTQLVYLVIADHLDAKEPGEILNVGFRRSHTADAAACKGNLGCGGELIDHVGIPGLTAQGDDIREGNKVTLKFMDAVSVVPDDGKIRGGGLQICETANGLVAEDNAVGIGILGNHPDHFYGGILHVFLNHVHIRPGRSHGDGNQLCTKELANLKMPVISGGGAEKFHRFFPAPGARTVKKAVGISTGHQVKHQVQRGDTADKNFLPPAPKNICPERPGAGKSCQFTVVPGINITVKTVIRRLYSV